MRLAITNSLLLSLLLAVFVLTGAAGCSTSKGSMPKAPARVGTHIADSSHDPSWTPPGELDFAFVEASRSSVSTAINAESMPRPNRHNIQRGQIHAATY